MLAALGIRDLFQLLRQIEIIPADNAVLDVDGEARSLPCQGKPERMRFASRADSFGRTHQDDSERSPGRRANEAVRDEPAHSETRDCRVEPPASILVARLSMSHLVPLLEFNPPRRSQALTDPRCALALLTDSPPFPAGPNAVG